MQPLVNRQNPNNSIEVKSPPENPLREAVSTLAFRPAAGFPCFVSASTWSGEIRCFQVDSNGTSTMKLAQNYGAPVLCHTWPDGSSIICGAADKGAYRLDVGTQQVAKFGQHDAPVKEIAWLEDLKMCVTGSWDKTLRYWDMRSPNAAATIQLPDRVYCMDAASPLLVVGLADNNLLIYDLRKPDTPFKQIASKLKKQLRCVACFPDRAGFAIGSIEGRVSIQHIDDKDAADPNKDFAFKCHRDGNNAYPVHSIKFNQQHGSFSTVGGDGVITFWDKDSKQRLKAFEKMAAPVTAGAFSPDGTIFAYAIGYDWAKGIAEAGKVPSQIWLHSCQEADVKLRPKVKK